MTVQTKITLFNRRLGADRREVYFPTSIDSASFMESRSSSQSTDGTHSQSPSFKLRIPVSAVIQDSKTYIAEDAYRALSDAEAAKGWTIQTGDVLLLEDAALTDPIDQTALDALVKSTKATLISVTEYADNTVRGSAAVQHWRIGGE